jgi:predicted AAA+ superfamily ATPase
MTPSLSRTFEEDISPAVLIPVLSHIAGQTIVKEKTLIFFDEVQLCERALTALKYFCEDAPDYHVIAAGSLLGLAVNRQEFSFPVGKVDMLTMYPMDLEEFLLAMGEDILIGRIRECIAASAPMPAAYHESAIQYYLRYLIVGGMPECVLQYVQTKDYILIRNTQQTILASYLNDMSKYNRNGKIQKTRLTYDNVTAQLSKRNTRFQYKLIKKGARAADILYMSEELEDFKGGMVENYVNAQLIAKGYKTYYWESRRGAEVDFVILRDGAVIPVEVKSADNTRAKSLKVYMETYSPEYAIKLSMKNFGFENKIMTVPLYATFCL